MDSMALYGILATALLYTGYHFLSRSRRVPDYALRIFSARNALIAPVVFQKVSGAVLLGLGSAAVVLLLSGRTLQDFGLSLVLFARTLYWVAAWLPVIAVACWRVSRKPGNYRVYPHIRIPDWGGGLIALNSAAWVVYLLGYEFMFRGFLLFACIPSMGLFWAIVVNAVMYSLAHAPQGARETIGSAPVGVLLCLVTVDTGNIWAAFFIHVLLSQTNDYLSLHANPEMRFKRKR